MATATKEHNRYGILSAAFVVMFFVAPSPCSVYF